MSDIFAEVDADLRRDRWQALWDRYGLLVICGAVGIVLLVVAIRRWSAPLWCRLGGRIARARTLVAMTPIVISLFRFG